MSEKPRPEFLDLQKIEDFWGEGETKPSGVSDLYEFEMEYGIKVPMLLKTLFSISNGGVTDYGYIQFEDSHYEVFPERVPEISSWESFRNYLDSFKIDDEGSLEYVHMLEEAYICYRHGFEFFVLFWHSENPDISEMGILDLATLPDDPKRFIKMSLDSNPFNVFKKLQY